MEKKKNFPAIPSTLSLDDLLEVKGGGDGITVECKVPGSGICLVVASVEYRFRNNDYRRQCLCLLYKILLIK